MARWASVCRRREHVVVGIVAWAKQLDRRLLENPKPQPWWAQVVFVPLMPLIPVGMAVNHFHGIDVQIAVQVGLSVVYLAVIGYLLTRWRRAQASR